MFRYLYLPLTAALFLVTGCADLKNIGKVPEFTPTQGSEEHFAMTSG